MQLNDDILRTVLSQNIRAARISAGLTQEALAEDSDISLNFLKDVEGGRSGTSLLTLINLCKSLKITPNHLLKDFFQDTTNTSENLIQQIHLLNDYEKDALLTLINYFNTHNS